MNITALALVGQLVDHYDRWQDNPNATSQYRGLTSYDLSQIMKHDPSTAHRNMEWLVDNGFADFIVVPYRNTTKKLYAPTLEAVRYWHKFKQTESGKNVYAFIASQWMEWYKQEVKKRYEKLGMKPPFRI